jgi:starch-binding outer membrane protein, SusD/RagB family
MIHKNKNIILFSAFCLILSLFSCGEQLDKSPRSSLTPDVALYDTTAYQSVLMSAYRRMFAFGYYGQTMILAPEALADNAVVQNLTGRYIAEFSNSVDAHVDIWEDVYRAINDCNLVIADVNDPSKSLSQASIWFKNRLHGEALFLRSLVLHDLARVYGYEPGNEVNGWNRSAVLRILPVRQATEVGALPRATNVQMYEQIEQDLKKADQLFSQIPTSSTFKVVRFPFRANGVATKALLARVQLYMGKYQDAKQNADDAIAINDVLQGGRTLSTNYGNNFANLTNGGAESLFELAIENVDWGATDGTNNSLNTITNNNQNTVPGARVILGPSQVLVDAFYAGTSDRRYLFQRVGDVTSVGYKEWKTNKWMGEKSLTIGGLENIQVIREAELYLISAEAKARLNDITSAVTTLNDYLGTRNVPLVMPTITQENLLEQILLENRLEFYFEGHRLFDLKRFKKPIIKPVKADGSANPNLEATDFRFIAKIPIAELNLNPSLVQNPGY